MPANKSIVGLYLHTFDDDSVFVLQGQIVGKEEGYYIVQTFSWMDGTNNRIVLIPFSDLIDQKRVRLYPDAEQMKSYFNFKNKVAL